MNLPYPKHPGATIEQLRTYQNQTTRWHTLNSRIANAETQSAIVRLIENSQDWVELFRAYRIAELAGMVYFHLSDKPGESEWVG